MNLADFRAKVIEILQHKGLRAYFASRSVPPEGRTKHHNFLTDVVARAGAFGEKANGD